MIYSPALPRTVVVLTPEQLAAKHARLRAEYQQWVVRQDALRAHDRRHRHAALGFGASAAVILAFALVGAGWWLWHALGALAAGSTGSLPGTTMVRLLTTLFFSGVGGGVTIVINRRKD